METSNLELSKELFELSGWHTSEEEVEIPEGCMWTPAQHYDKKHSKFYPAYDLGFLLRKLPRGMEVRFLLLDKRTGVYVQSSKVDYPQIYEYDTAEDCLCKLAIELFKQGVLKK